MSDHQRPARSSASPHGILKTSSGTEAKKGRGVAWDEANIIRNEALAGKEYGTMKIVEPKTPYHYYSDSSSVEDSASAFGRSPADPTAMVSPIALREQLSSRIRQPQIGDAMDETDDHAASLLAESEEESESVQRTSEDNALQFREERRWSESESDADDLHHREFVMKRKEHYNMKQAIEEARRQIQAEAESEEKKNQTTK